MSALQIPLPFKGRQDFKNECFYYFLPLFNHSQKIEIGEKITKFQGSISFSLKENIYILIENSMAIKSPEFEEEVLCSGDVVFYLNGQKKTFNCIKRTKTDKKEKKFPKYNCLLLNGKQININIKINPT